MRCTIVCDCGRSLDVDLDDGRSECLDCGASYAVTVTQLQSAAESPDYGQGGYGAPSQ